MNASPNVTIRPTRPEHDERIIEIFNRLHHDQPPMSVESYRSWVFNRPEGARLERFVAEVEGVLAGSYDLREASWVKRSHTWIAYLEVDAPYQGRGIGSMLYDHLLTTAGRMAAARIYGVVREDQPKALTFVEKRGCTRTGRIDRMSRLEVRAANLEGFREALERVGELGIKIRSLESAGADNEVLLRELHAMEARAARDMPSSEDATGDPFESWRQRVLHSEGRSPRWFWIALDGKRPVGVARLTMRTERAAFNGLTAVDREYRGKGIAKALKLRTVEWAREQGIEYIYTGNDEQNHAMLAVNVALGYKPLVADIEVVKELIPEHRETA